MTSMSYSAYDGGMPRSMSRMSRRASMQSNFQQPYFPEQPPVMYQQNGYDMQAYNTPRPVPLTRRMSSRSYDDRTPYFPAYQALPQQLPMVINPVQQRHRRNSTMTYTAPRPSGVMDFLRRPSSIRIKFKRKGALLGGISLSEAQMRGVRLSNSDSYYMSDLHSIHENIYLKVRWPGYQELMYHVPLDSYRDGKLHLETLARRVARSCVHYFQTNRISVSWDRMDLKCLEELEFGVWEPTLTINHLL